MFNQNLTGYIRDKVEYGFDKRDGIAFALRVG
jgi:hypothetical protein